MTDAGARRAVRMVPVAALKLQVMALDAAMLVAAGAAEEGAVHKLRTLTRRVEAQIALLEALGSEDGPPLHLPHFGDEAGAVAKRLRRVRRAAGAVRDLDVQTEAIRTDAPTKAEVHAHTAGDTVRRQAKALRKELETQRKHEARKLVTLLDTEKERLALRLAALEETLKPAVRRSVAGAVLAERMAHMFSEKTGRVLRAQANAGESLKDAVRRVVQGLGEDDLHAVRKAAKLCRYMGESAPEGAQVGALSKEFEALQEAGGTWHDWLLLEQRSKQFHGKDAVLTKRYGKHAAAALEEYRMLLAEQLPKVLAKSKLRA